MSRVIALIVGAWVMYCSMIGSYDGAISLLVIYVSTVVIDPFYLRHEHKKGTTAANSRTQK